MLINDTTRPAFITLAPQAKDLTGQRFGRLVALGPVGRSTKREIYWLCQCDCGATAVVKATSVAGRGKKSCGCLGRELLSKMHTTHGKSNHPLYIIWTDIIQRCNDPKTKAYVNYGGRGISICNEWRHSFEAFYDHVSGLPHYGENGYSLDRIDNNGNYQPGNLRLATRTEQSRNTRKNVMLIHDGKTRCISEWAEETGIASFVIQWRISHGWSAERTLTVPVQRKAELAGLKRNRDMPEAVATEPSE